jgi:hypothetical protein
MALAETRPADPLTLGGITGLLAVVGLAIRESPPSHPG